MFLDEHQHFIQTFMPDFLHFILVFVFWWHTLQKVRIQCFDKEALSSWKLGEKTDTAPLSWLYANYVSLAQRAETG